MQTRKALTLELLRRRYRRAERAIKRSALISGAVPVPAVNQLRYVGCHIFGVIEAQKAGDAAKEQSHLVKADNHCDRAWFDAFDCIACHHLEVIRKFEEKRYPISVIEKYIPDYTDKMAHARKVYCVYRLPECVQSMTLRQRADRMKGLKAVAGFYHELVKLSKSFHDALNDLDKKRRQRECVKNFFAGLTSMICSVFGVLLSAAGLAVVDQTTHPDAVCVGRVGMCSFSVLFVINLIVLGWIAWNHWNENRQHPSWDQD